MPGSVELLEEGAGSVRPRNHLPRLHPYLSTPRGREVQDQKKMMERNPPLLPPVMKEGGWTAAVSLSHLRCLGPESSVFMGEKRGGTLGTARSWFR